ncbi:carbohydrate ABC transporter permease [Cellulomonas sp. DKR-3]|uniref:Carbohydrate ABC transporter permease n=1 Tax=Cellulomonas fulva TaxID=2835530 RepID=A0ABS5TV07_9CELL|nr:carbohydrate ABC transporter permease [Cellulomonas fulva]MBT0992988.1 carbohydrate ABC transporter permease [Cellulomonas fulva]
MKTSRSERTMNYFVLTLFAAAVVFPIGWTVLAALSPDRSGSPDVGSLQWSNFADAWRQGDLGHAMLASTVITVCAVIIQALVAILSGYALGVLGVPGSKVIFPVILLGLMISTEVIVIPLYYQFRDLGLTNSWLGLIAIHVGMGVPFGAFWLRATFRAMPRSLVEAAEIDGAGSWRRLWQVLVPIARPAILTLTLLNFMWTWNDYFLSLIFISSEKLQPVTLALGNFQGRYSTEFNLLAAAALIICVPVVLLYAFFQRQFISGVMSGALKE